MLYLLVYMYMYVVYNYALYTVMCYNMYITIILYWICTMCIMNNVLYT